MQLQLYTTDGWMDLDADYIPRVVTAEHGIAADEALKALAVASRTFVLRAMRDSPKLGTVANPIHSGENFQVYTKGKPYIRCIEATQKTAGIVARYQGKLTLANYVAGAIWTDGKPNPNLDHTHTERWVTYNQGKSGAAVKPTTLSDKTRKDNRGCMSQHGSDWLAQHGRDYRTIMRFFYGEDIELGPLAQQPATPNAPTPVSTTSGLAPLVLGALAVAFMWDK